MSSARLAVRDVRIEKVKRAWIEYEAEVAEAEARRKQKITDAFREEQEVLAKLEVGS